MFLDRLLEAAGLHSGLMFLTKIVFVTHVATNQNVQDPHSAVRFSALRDGLLVDQFLLPAVCFKQLTNFAKPSLLLFSAISEVSNKDFLSTWPLDEIQ